MSSNIIPQISSALGIGNLDLIYCIHRSHKLPSMLTTHALITVTLLSKPRIPPSQKHHNPSRDSNPHLPPSPSLLPPFLVIQHPRRSKARTTTKIIRSIRQKRIEQVSRPGSSRHKCRLDLISSIPSLLSAMPDFSSGSRSLNEDAVFGSKTMYLCKIASSAQGQLSRFLLRFVPWIHNLVAYEAN